MRAFTYERATDPVAAARAAAQPGAKFIAGGTNLIDLMKLEIETPTHLTARAFRGATPTKDNAFKLPLATRALAAVIAQAKEQAA